MGGDCADLTGCRRMRSSGLPRRRIGRIGSIRVEASRPIGDKLRMRETRHTFCRICEALCGLEVDVEGNRVVDIRPDKQHVTTDGFGCMKGLKQHKLFGSPDRVTRPLKRDGSTWREVSWAQALDEIGRKVRAIRATSSPNAIAMY